jgi:hypothetical protein
MLDDIKGWLSEATTIELRRKKAPFVITTASKILNESWALVYLIIPAKVLTPADTIELSTANINILRLSSI